MSARSAQAPASRAAVEPGAPNPGVGLEHDRRDRWTAAWIALATLAVTVLLNLPLISAYHTTGDTAALVLHSTRFFHVSPLEWITSGFSGYFSVFPEATREYTAFVRPTVNLSFWLESLLAPSPHSRVFLLTNYLGHAACAALVYLVARRIGGVGRRRALLAAALFAGTAAALELLQSPAFRADMLGALLGAAALLAVDAHLRGGSRRWMAGAVILLSLAVLAKETAVAAPLVCAGWAAWGPRAPRGRRRWTPAIVLLAPLALFVAARLVVPEAGVYTAFHPRNAVQTLSSAFFPGGGALELMALARGGSGGADALRAAAALTLNAAGAVLALRAILVRRDRRIVALAAMAFLALGVPMAMAAYTRLMYFGQVFALPLFAAVLPRAAGRMRAAAPALAIAAIAVGPGWLAARSMAMQPELVATSRDGRATREAVVRALGDPSIRRIYLVNDVAGAYGARALLQLSAAEAGRGDVALRVTNSMGRFGPDERRGTMRVRRAGGDLRVEMACGAACDFSFPGVLPEDRARLGVPGVIRYGRVEDRRLDFTIPGAGGGDVALVGFDPSAPGARVFRW